MIPGWKYPEIREFVKTFDNVDWIKPKMNFKKVITEYGYPFISKEVSDCVDGARRYMKALTDRQTDSAVQCVYVGHARSGQENKQKQSDVSRTEKGDYP